MTKAILFDLDGTLLDSAEDLGNVINTVRARHALPVLPVSHYRPLIGKGVKSLLQLGLEIDESHPYFQNWVDECLSLYQEQSTEHSRLFPGIDTVLDELDHLTIPWGIVTNKTSRFTFDILKFLKLDKRVSCVVCGDTLQYAKPHPAPVLHALDEIACEAKDSLFVGDTKVDVEAAHAAGTKVIVALYGYIDQKEDPFTWCADGYVEIPKEILKWVK